MAFRFLTVAGDVFSRLGARFPATSEQSQPPPEAPPAAPQGAVVRATPARPQPATATRPSRTPPARQVTTQASAINVADARHIVEGESKPLGLVIS